MLNVKVKWVMAKDKDIEMRRRIWKKTEQKYSEI
jgi:hypothetical protein